MFVEQLSGKTTPIKYGRRKYVFDIWAPSIRNNISKSNNDDDMDCNQAARINSISGINRFAVLGAESEDEGF